jgi:hypothetical protein
MDVEAHSGVIGPKARESVSSVSGGSVGRHNTPNKPQTHSRSRRILGSRPRERARGV